MKYQDPFFYLGKQSSKCAYLNSLGESLASFHIVILADYRLKTVLLPHDTIALLPQADGFFLEHIRWCY